MSHGTEKRASLGLAGSEVDSQRRAEEMHLLVGQLRCELRKIDESLKVMAAFIDRVRGSLCGSDLPPR